MISFNVAFDEILGASSVATVVTHVLRRPPVGSREMQFERSLLSSSEVAVGAFERSKLGVDCNVVPRNIHLPKTVGQERRGPTIFGESRTSGTHPFVGVAHVGGPPFLGTQDYGRLRLHSRLSAGRAGRSAELSNIAFKLFKIC